MPSPDDDRDETFRLDWPGRRQALHDVDTPPATFLDAVPGDGVDEETTGNLFVDGDNLEALKNLRPDFAGRIRLLYADPPYNTGNDFVFHDDYAETAAAFRRRARAADPRGRRHAAWLSLLYPRLRLARDFLTPDGILFLSIDDHEVHHLRNLCDEIFGLENFLAQIVVQANPRGRQSSRHFAVTHEYLLVYARDADACRLGHFPLSDEQRGEYALVDALGRRHRLLGLRQRGVDSLATDVPTMFFPLYVDPDTLAIATTPDARHRKEVIPRKSDGREGRWMWSREKCQRDGDRLVARWIKRRGEFDVFVRDYLERDGQPRGRKPTTLWDGRHLNTQNGTKEVKALLGCAAASFPKPLDLLGDILALAGDPDDLTMDFFAGSGGWGHAVMRQNARDGGRRRFILIQEPAPLDPRDKTQQPAAAFCDALGKPRTLSQIACERLRRAGASLRGDHPGAAFDAGFRVLRATPRPSGESGPPLPTETPCPPPS